MNIFDLFVFKNSFFVECNHSFFFSLDSMYYKQYYSKKTALSISRTHTHTPYKKHIFNFFSVYFKIFYFRHTFHFSFNTIDRSRIQFCAKFTNNVYCCLRKKKNFLIMFRLYLCIVLIDCPWVGAEFEYVMSATLGKTFESND
jgi:hypothetical protein